MTRERGWNRSSPEVVYRLLQMLISRSLSTIVTSRTGSSGSRLWATRSRTAPITKVVQVSVTVSPIGLDIGSGGVRISRKILVTVFFFFFFFLLFIFSEFFCLVAEKVLRKLGENCISEFRLKFKLVL